MVREP